MKGGGLKEERLEQWRIRWNKEHQLGGSSLFYRQDGDGLSLGGGQLSREKWFEIGFEHQVDKMGKYMILKPTLHQFCEQKIPENRETRIPIHIIRA